MQDGLGEKIGMFLRFFMTFLLTFVYAFVQNWQLTLVLCATIPIIIVLGQPPLLICLCPSIHSHGLSTQCG
jgi:hypothetical protein